MCKKKDIYIYIYKTHAGHSVWLIIVHEMIKLHNKQWLYLSSHMTTSGAFLNSSN